MSPRKARNTVQIQTGYLENAHKAYQSSDILQEPKQLGAKQRLSNAALSESALRIYVDYLEGRLVYRLDAPDS